MAYIKADKDDVESQSEEYYGGMWLYEDTLDAKGFNLLLLELESGGRGKKHDHSEENEEEVYFVMEGEVEIILDEEERVSLSPDEAMYLTPDQTRQIDNTGDDRAKIVIVQSVLDE
jgi:mannose-6-phosphate isomerase-like protein (cupin superfamily)